MFSMKTQDETNTCHIQYGRISRVCCEIKSAIEGLVSVEFVVSEIVSRNMGRFACDEGDIGGEIL